ncbi:major facilitator superfamily domain-containing protein 8-like isoform X1 [Culicoides brevitarsis]|uniref:major facilitator superfamily domain-containing protein 8-like isoform X1 n=2 Tax=Culicoides brevitarsis TaxID=469753 RepID=UPI00307BBCC5
MDWFKKVFRRGRVAEVNRKELHNPSLETETEYRERWVSIRIIYFTMFLMSLGFSIILTGIWPYLSKMDPDASKEFMGYIVAANPLAQMIFSPLVGWIANKLGSNRIPLLSSLSLFTFASGLYSTIDLFPSHKKYWLLASRFLIGLSSANIAVARSYLSAATTIDERTGAVGMVSLAQVLGFIVGPALQAAVTPFGDKGFLLWGFLPIDMYTAAGWINVFMGILNLCLFLPFIFKERKIAAKEIMVLQGKTSEKETWKAIKPDYVSAWTLIGAFFILVFHFVLLETLGTPLVMDQFAWTKEEAVKYMGILMAVGSVIACASFVSIKPMTTKFEERKVLLWGGFFLMALAAGSCIPMGSEPPKLAYPVELNGTLDHNNNTIWVDENEVGCPIKQEWCATTNALTIPQFIFGYGLTSWGYPIGVTLIQTIFSKILGPRPQGTWMGILTGAGCFSRVLGPLYISFVYTNYGTYFTFGSITFLMLSCMLWLYIVRGKLVPPIYEKPATEMIEIVSKKPEDETQQIPKTEKSTNISTEDAHQSISLLKNEDDDDRR